MHTSSRISHNKCHTKNSNNYWDYDEQADQEFHPKLKSKRHESKRDRDNYYDKRYFKSEKFDD